MNNGIQNLNIDRHRSRTSKAVTTTIASKGLKPTGSNEQHTKRK